MATRKNYYYVGVRTKNGMQLVTQVHGEGFTCWRRNEIPLAMKKREAVDLRERLNMKLYLAAVVISPFKIEGQWFTAEVKDDSPPWDP